MTIGEDLLNEARQTNRFLEVQTGIMHDIQTELQIIKNERNRRTPGLWERFRYWLKGMMRK